MWFLLTRIQTLAKKLSPADERAIRGQPGNKTLTKSSDEEYISEFTHEERVQMMKDRQERIKERKRNLLMLEKAYLASIKDS